MYFDSLYLCVQNVIYVVLTTFLQINFFYLPRFIIISSLYRTFSLSINVHEQNIGTQEFLLRKSYEGFDIGIVKKLRKFQNWAKKFSHKNIALYMAKISRQSSFTLGRGD